MRTIIQSFAFLPRQHRLTFFILVAILEGLNAATAQDPKALAITKTIPSFTYEIIDGNHNTFGYDVYVDKKLKVHQPSVPALPGNDGFKTKAAAEKVAQLVIQKMKKGEMPPTVTANELKKLKAY